MTVSYSSPVISTGVEVYPLFRNSKVFYFFFTFGSPLRLSGTIFFLRWIEKNECLNKMDFKKGTTIDTMTILQGKIYKCAISIYKLISMLGSFSVCYIVHFIRMNKTSPEFKRWTTYKSSLTTRSINITSISIFRKLYAYLIIIVLIKAVCILQICNNV